MKPMFTRKHFANPEVHQNILHQWVNSAIIVYNEQDSEGEEMVGKEEQPQVFILSKILPPDILKSVRLFRSNQSKKIPASLCQVS